MRSHQGEFSIDTMCTVFGVKRAAYYAWRDRPESARVAEDRELGDLVEQIHTENKRRYGAPRIEQELRKRGRKHSKKRVARLLKERGLRPRRATRRVKTTDSKHSHPVAPNLLAREFTAEAPNQKWAGDITYIPTDEGWLYLAVVIDLFSRKVIGWSMSDRIDQQLTRSAMLMALKARKPKGPLLVHSDRGVQYAAGDYRQLLKDWTLTPSMSRTGNCWDNAPSESFFATMKTEQTHHEHYATRDEARRRHFEYIEMYYNRVRLHSTLGYLSPVEFEALSAYHE